MKRGPAAGGAPPARQGRAGALLNSPPPKPHVTSAPASPSAAPRWHVTKPLRDVLAVVFVALLVLALLAGGSLRPRKRRPHPVSQIGRYGPPAAAPAPSGAPPQRTPDAAPRCASDQW